MRGFIKMIDESYQTSSRFEEYMKNIILKKGVEGLPTPQSRMEILLWELCVQLSEEGSGSQGKDGKSAYELAVENGFEGDLQAWLDSLVGPAGPAGKQGVQGPKGDPGAKGYTPVRGVDYWTESDISEINAYIDSKIAEITKSNTTE